MERISVFDIFKIGIGPSSSHTMGPWRAMQMCLTAYKKHHHIDQIRQVTVDLFGSLAKTGKGHGTDIALQLALSGEDPETIDPDSIDQKIANIRQSHQLSVAGEKTITFDTERDICFHPQKKLSFHANALTIHILSDNDKPFKETYYSIGGGFVVQGKTTAVSEEISLPYPIDTAKGTFEMARNDGQVHRRYCAGK